MLPSCYFLSFPIHSHLLSDLLVAIYTHVSNLQLRRVESNKARLSLVSYDANSSRDCVILSACKFIFGVKLVLCFVHAMFLSTQALKA